MAMTMATTMASAGPIRREHTPDGFIGPAEARTPRALGFSKRKS
jgi:hypothetical protein